MNCNTINPCQCDEHLIFNIDLRTGQPVRLNKIAQELVPFGDKIGEHHISVNLVYRQENETKHINLPAYVIETPQERILNILFPADTKVSIKQAEQTANINRLAYHIDKLTETVTEESAFVTIESVGNLNILSISLSDITAEKGISSDAIIASLQAQAAKITDWQKPIEIRFNGTNGIQSVAEVTKLERTINDVLTYICIKVQRPELAKNVIDKNSITINLYISKDNSVFAQTTASNTTDDNEVIYLYENNDGIIGLTDFDPQWQDYTIGNWDRFDEKISRKQTPLTFMSTPTSGQYCPVSYHFNYNPETSALVSGVMDISYYKEVEGQLQLWIERRNFNGNLSTYTGDEGIGEPKIIKYALGTPIS